MTFKELIIRHDAYTIDRWWHTAWLSSQLYNIQTIVYNALGGKTKMKPKMPSEMHPFIKPESHKRRIKASGIGLLKMIGNAMCGGR